MGAGEEAKIDFQDGGHLGFSIGTILAIFYQQVTPKLPTHVQVNWSFGSGEVKNRFKDGHHGGHLGFPIRTILPFFFYLQVTPMLPTKFQVNWLLGSGE